MCVPANWSMDPYRLRSLSIRSASTGRRCTSNRRALRVQPTTSACLLWQDRARIEFDDFLLVWLPRVDVDDRGCSTERLGSSSGDGPCRRYKAVVDLSISRRLEGKPAAPTSMS